MLWHSPEGFKFLKTVEISSKNPAIVEIAGFLFWSEWRDLNPRPLGPEPSTLPSALHPEIVAGFPDNICCTQILYTGGAVLSNEILHFLCFCPPDFRADLRRLML